MSDWTTTEVVVAAADGDEQAWNEIVRRFTPLVRSVTAGYRLTASDADDVMQTVWLRLVENLGRLREPQALPGWISRTARNECNDIARTRGRVVVSTDVVESAAPGVDPPDVAERLWTQQRNEALLGALALLSDAHRSLLLTLLEDPPPSYDEVSRRLSMPIGSIGPTRARALTRLRECHALLGVSDPDLEATP